MMAEESAEEAAEPEGTAGGGALGGAAEEGDRQEDEAAEQEAESVEGERREEVESVFLRDEGQPPDEGGQKEKEIRAQGLGVHGGGL